jgi:hypothetical protein
MSLTPCAHDGRQRPVDFTCAERCERFPKCVPPTSPQVKGRIARTLQAGAVERNTVERLLATLEAALRDDSPHGRSCSEE